MQRPWGGAMPGTFEETQRGLWGWAEVGEVKGRSAPWQHMGIMSCTCLGPSFQSRCCLINLPSPAFFLFLFSFSPREACPKLSPAWLCPTGAVSAKSPTEHITNCLQKVTPQPREGSLYLKRSSTTDVWGSVTHGQLPPPRWYHTDCTALCWDNAPPFLQNVGCRVPSEPHGRILVMC